jgi:hypothetical protein
MLVVLLALEPSHHTLAITFKGRRFIIGYYLKEKKNPFSSLWQPLENTSSLDYPQMTIMGKQRFIR